MGFEVVEIQPTPNPNAAKFVLDRPVAEQPVSFFSADAAVNHPLASLAIRLFAIPGVSSIFFLKDFVTVNKQPNAKWPALKRSVKKALATNGPAEDDQTMTNSPAR